MTRARLPNRRSSETLGKSSETNPLWRKRATWLLQVAADHEQQRAALHVAIAIASHIKEATLSAWPSQQTLARLTGLSVKHVGDQITALKISGHLKTRSRGPDTPIITIIIDDAEDPHHSADHPDHDDTNHSADQPGGKDPHRSSGQDPHHSAEHFPERPHPQFQMTPPPGGTEQLEGTMRAGGRARKPTKVVVAPPVLSAARAATSARADAWPADDAASSSPEAGYFRFCRSVFGSKDGGWIGKSLLKAKGSIAAAHTAARDAAGKGDPKSYAMAMITGGATRRGLAVATDADPFGYGIGGTDMDEDLERRLMGDRG